MNPFNLMPTSDPNKFPQLFNSGNPFGPKNQPKIPVFKRPNVFVMTAKQAFDFVSFLNTLGFMFGVPKYIDHATLEGQFVNADLSDSTPREYYASHYNFVGEVLLALAVDTLGGQNSSPTNGLYQILADVGLEPKNLKVFPTNEQIVESLKTIFV